MTAHRILQILAISVALTAHAAVAAPTRAPEPSQGRETFKGCRWGQVNGAHLSMWSFACGPDQGGERLVADDALPGFAIVSATDPAARRVVMRTFAKPAAASITAILPALRAASPGPHTASCTLQSTPGGPGRYALSPTGNARAAWESAQTSAAEPDFPCGPLGVGYVGDRYVRLMPGHADTVVFIDEGSEVQIFDPATLRRR